jgi:CO/xanthine dehydrogenase FAD-binding subunit
VDFLQPTRWADALRLRAERPDAVAVTGGTDVLVELNANRIRPPALLDLSHVEELRGVDRDGDVLRVAAGSTYHDLIAALGHSAPALVEAARSVGSPQVRNRGTVGGNLATASPAGDCHPPLLALAAAVELSSVQGTRYVPTREFFLGPKRSVLRHDELIAAVHVPIARGPQHFAKVGPRNAMVIAVCSLALSLDMTARAVGTGAGSVGPTPVVAQEGEAFLAGALDEVGFWDRRSLPSQSAVARFAELVAGAARPIDDVRGTAGYRRHALQVLAQRLLTWSLQEAGRAAA